MKDIILDCDPGQDDALAILLALGSQNINLKAISVVGGNVPVEKCRRNALRVLCLAERLDVPVYEGAPKPLRNALMTLENVFGESGLAGAESWPVPDMPPQKQGAIDFLTDSFSSATAPLLCATAPQTNIALALRKNPKIAQNIPSLTMMGGCVFPEPVRGRMGNLPVGDDYAEYNIAVDPEAANIVLNSGIKQINMIGLNVTRKVLYNEKADTRLRQINSKIALAVADMLSTIGEDDVADYGPLRKTPSDPVRAIHDAVAMCYLEDPSVFTAEICPIKITDVGQTLPDDKGVCVNVVTDVNAEAFFDILFQNIARL